MCGRFTQLKSEVEIGEFKADFLETRLVPRYNIAPTQDSPVIAVINGDLRLEQMRFGLVPFWAKDSKVGYKMINARAETVARKPSYRAQFKRKRCLVLADGYYEWRKDQGGKQKTPFRFVMKDRAQFAFGGLWDSWKDPEGQTLRSFSIITTEPSPLAARVHDRMPFVLPPDRYQRWLDPEFEDADELASWLEPYPEEEMDLYEVSSVVSNPKNERPECIEPINSA